MESLNFIGWEIDSWSNTKNSESPIWVSRESSAVNVCERGSLVDAQKVFDEMSERNLVSWNTIISAYAENDVFDNAKANRMGPLIMGFYGLC